MGKREKLLWTESTYECFKNDCQCSSACKNYELCQRVAKTTKNGQPPIKKIVDDLLTKGIAIPLAVTDSIADTLDKKDSMLLRLWILEGLDYKTIGKKLKVTETTVYNRLLKMFGDFKYSYARKDYVSEDFARWAKTELIPELDRLEKVGVEC